MNFLVLPLVVLLVTALMATLAMPLGPLLRVDAAAAGLRHRHRRIDDRHRRLHAPVRRRHDAARLVRRRGGPGRPCSRSARASHVVAAAAARRAGRASLFLVDQRRRRARRRLVALLPDHAVHDRHRRQIRRQRQRHPAPGAAPGRRPPKEPFYDQVYKLVPGPDLRQRPDRRRRQRHGRGDGARSTAPGHVDAVEIDPKIQQIGIDVHPNHPYEDPRVTAHRQRRPGVPPRRTRSTTWSSSRCRTR